jgi:hypothetical protein
MRTVTAFILFVLAFFQSSGSRDDLAQLTARAIRENQPSVCEKAKEFCYTNDFERHCISASDNRFVCYREYAFAKNDSSICEKIRGESGSGHPYRDECFEHYARDKKDIGVCEKLKSTDRTNKILYADCIDSVQQLRGNYVLDECLKIKDLGEPYAFAKCIAGVARQTKDLPLCSRMFSESTIVDPWGDTLLKRCEKQAQVQR